jgi:hypothetical protein
VSSGAIAAALAENAATACVPTAVIATTLKVASLLAVGQTAAAGAASAHVAALTQGVLKTMFVTKLRTVTALCLTVGLVLMLGTGWGYSTFAADKPKAEKQTDNLRDTLLVLDKQFWEAGAKHDVDTLNKLIAHDYLGIAADGTKFTKDATLHNYRAMRTADLELTTARDVVRINEHSAVVTYQGTYKVFNKSGGLLATPYQSMTSCWVQRDGGWFVVFSRVSDLPKPTAALLLPNNPFDVELRPFADPRILPPISACPDREFDFISLVPLRTERQVENGDTSSRR